jgi:hypothetical protein
VLQRLEDSSYALFAGPDAATLAALSPASVLRRRDMALQQHRSGLAAVTPRSVASRKQLQSRLRASIETYKSSRLDRLRRQCEVKLEELMLAHLSGEQRDPASASATATALQLKLGESANVYSQFLSFKNALEKIVHSFLVIDTAALLSSGEKNEEAESAAESGGGTAVTDTQTETEGGESSSSSLSFYLEVEGVEASVLKHDVLHDFVIRQVRRVLQMGQAWLGAYEALAAGATERMNSLGTSGTRIEVSCVATILASICIRCNININLE